MKKIIYLIRMQVKKRLKEIIENDDFEYEIEDEDFNYKIDDDWFE